MDLTASFQTQFQQLVAQIKINVIAEVTEAVTRSIDEQATELYSLFASELTRLKQRGVPGSSTTVPGRSRPVIKQNPKELNQKKVITRSNFAAKASAKSTTVRLDAQKKPVGVKELAPKNTTQPVEVSDEYDEDSIDCSIVEPDVEVEQPQQSGHRLVPGPATVRRVQSARSSTTSKDYACSHCECTFTKKNQLQRHMGQHYNASLATSEASSLRSDAIVGGVGHLEVADRHQGGGEEDDQQTEADQHQFSDYDDDSIDCSCSNCTKE